MSRTAYGALLTAEALLLVFCLFQMCRAVTGADVPASMPYEVNIPSLAVAVPYRDLTTEPAPQAAPIAIDPNTEYAWTFDPKSEELYENMRITIGSGPTAITLEVRDGKFDVIGDPNHYTKAARTFFAAGCPEAVYGLVAGDKRAIRRLCESGKVCEVMGHQWGLDYFTNALYKEKCGLCGRQRQKTHVSEHWTDWKESPAE